MGRRHRRRANEETRDHIARVQTTDATWLEFRRALGVTPVSHALGQLVEAEVSRQRQRRVRHGNASDRDLLDALAEARELYEQLDQLVGRLEARAARNGAVAQTEAW